LNEEAEMGAMTIAEAVLPVVSQAMYLVTLIFSIYLTWLKIRARRRDQDK
jgi:hypothetical protein